MTRLLLVGLFPRREEDGEHDCPPVPEEADTSGGEPPAEPSGEELPGIVSEQGEETEVPPGGKAAEPRTYKRWLDAGYQFGDLLPDGTFLIRQQKTTRPDNITPYIWRTASRKDPG